MARPHNDSVLGSIALTLSDYVFPPAKDAAWADKARATLMSGQRFRHVTRWPKGGGWCVNMYIGGKVRVLATYRSDYMSACRMADLLFFRLGARRLKYNCPAKPSDYNFSAEQAKHDWETELRLRPTFELLEKHLEELGALTVTQEVHRRSVYDSLVTVKEDYKSLEQKYIELNDRLSNMKQEMNVLAKSLTKLYENQTTKQS